MTISYSEFINYLRHGEIAIKCGCYYLYYTLSNNGKLYACTDFSCASFPSEYIPKEFYEEYLESPSDFKFIRNKALYGCGGC